MYILGKKFTFFLNLGCEKIFFRSKSKNLHFFFTYFSIRKKRKKENTLNPLRFQFFFCYFWQLLIKTQKQQEKYLKGNLLFV